MLDRSAGREGLGRKESRVCSFSRGLRDEEDEANGRASSHQCVSPE